MVKPTWQLRHSELCAELREHEHAYYVLDKPTLADSAYDALLRELRQIEAEHPELVSPASPTQRVGAPIAGDLPKVAHPLPMYSLDNAYTREEFGAFARRVSDALATDSIAWVAEPKLDGASVELTYRSGRLVQALTRGDGRFGEDVTQTLRTLRSLPLVLSEPIDWVLRGEVYIHTADLETVNAQRRGLGEEPFVNPRNAAAGSLRLLDPRIAAQRPLRLCLYEAFGTPFATQHEVLSVLRSLRLPTHGLEQLCPSVDAAWEAIEGLRAQQSALPYPTDGVVIKVDKLALRERLGATARHYRWAVAYKFPAEQAAARIAAISADVGRTGAITPVATMAAPVFLSGTSVSKASLHNSDYVREHDIRVGDSVLIEKAGEIIPQVVSVLRDQRIDGTQPWQEPTHCPRCATPLVRQGGEVALRCPNRICPGRLEAGIWHFARRGAMDIEGLGPVLIRELTERGWVRNVADLFRLSARRSELENLPRMGKKSVERLLRGIESARQGRSLAQLLTGLGIPLVGQVAAEKIAQEVGSLRALHSADGNELEASLAHIEGIGPKIAASLVAYREQEQELLAELLAENLVLEARSPGAAAAPQGPLVGLSFCVTGKLSQPRSAIHATIKRQGGAIHTAITRKTRYLVAGEGVGTNKRKQAEAYGTEVIDESQLRAMARLP